MTAYNFKTILCSIVLLIVYKGIFEKEKTHRYNRFYLLLSLAFTFVVPVINITVSHPVIPVLDNIPSFEYPITVSETTTGQVIPILSQSENGYEKPNYLSILSGLYIVITGLLY